MRYTLADIRKRFYKFNDMEFDKEVSIKMAKILVEKFGFEDKKYYSHVNRVVQMFDWEKGDGTLFLTKDGLYHKYEVGKASRNGKGWFIADIEECYEDSDYFAGSSFVGGENKKMSFVMSR